jgi:uncharacterized membrane protein
MLREIIVSSLVLSLFVHSGAAYETRYPPNPNARWVAALVGGLGLAVLMIIILFIISQFVIVFMRQQRLKARAAAAAVGAEPYHQLATSPGLDDNANAKEKFVYYNRGMEPDEAEARSRGGRAKILNADDIRRIEVSNA